MTDIHASGRYRTHRGGFTLTELMVAVVVLLVIILAVGRIFGTASQVVKNGEATANILQETAAVEQLMRNDLDRISDEGFLMVQCVAVRNDAGGQLLDPTLPPGHIFRCDQIAFVADDLAISRQTQSMGQFIEKEPDGQGRVDYLGQTLPTPQSTASVLYYGHGIQFPFLPQNLPWPVDIYSGQGAVTVQPWFRPNPGQGQLDFQRWPGGQNGGSYNATQPPADQWTLARQETLLADDYDGDAGHYMSKVVGTNLYRNAAAQFFDPTMASGRVDVLSNDIGRLRDAIRAQGPQGIANVLFNYRPRAEKRPPTLDKADVLLTTNVLSMNCSNFVVDWTWSDGVGRELELDLDPSRNLKGAMRGVSHRGGVRPAVGGESSATVTEASGRMPWFGLGSQYGNPNPEVVSASSQVGQGFYNAPIRFHAPIAYDAGNEIFQGGPGASTPFGAGSNTVPQVLSVIEQQGPGGAVIDTPMNGVWRYRAFFGLNGKEPFVRDGENRPVTTASVNGGLPWPIYRSDYTPWPSALRITATFHDPQGAIEGGRTLQFTIPLPKRVQDLPEG